MTSQQQAPTFDANSSTAYTEQNDLEKAMNSNQDPEDMAKIKEELRTIGRQILDKAFEDNGVNILVGPVDSGFCIHACAAGKSPRARRAVCSLC